MTAAEKFLLAIGIALLLLATYPARGVELQVYKLTYTDAGGEEWLWTWEDLGKEECEARRKTFKASANARCVPDLVKREVL